MAFKVFGLTETATGTRDFSEHQIDGTFPSKAAALAAVANLSAWATVDKDSTANEEILIRSTMLDRIIIRQVPDVDEFLSSVVLLLDWAGEDGATNVTDLSDSAHVATFKNQAQIDTDLQSPLGTNSLLLDGTTDDVTLPDSDDWSLGTGDFTVELSVNFASLAGTQTLLGHSGGGSDGGLILRLTNPNLVWVIGNITVATRDWSPTTSTWYHVAISRVGTGLRVFIDGVQQGFIVTDSTDITGTTRLFGVGSQASLAAYLNGSIGPVRLTKGVGRYTADFTPPTEMYPTS